MKSQPKTEALLHKAVAHHQAGRLAAAEALYVKVIKAEPRNADALNLLGAIAHRRNQVKKAKTFFERAIARNPDIPDIHFNLGNLLSTMGDSDGALAAYGRAIALKPAYGDAHLNLGVLLYKADRFEEAAECFRSAAASAPLDPRGHYNLGQSLAKLCLAKLSLTDDAEVCLKRALELNPKYLEAHLALAALYTEGEDRIVEAAAHLREAIGIDPRPEYYSNLGDLLRRAGDIEAALAAHLKALASLPDEPAILHNYAVTLHANGQFQQAREIFRRALTCDPGFIKSYIGLAKVCEHLGLLDEAISLLAQGVALNSQSPELLLKLSFLQLATGSLQEGWRNYESRMATGVKRVLRHSPPAYWAGEDLSGKTILIWGEQGLGDEILYGSMVSEMIARAGRCIVECTPRMVPIFARSFPRATISPFYVQGVSTTPAAGVDFQAAIASIGQFLRPDLESFPRDQGYLKADEARTAELRARYQAINPGNLVVGLAWRSKNVDIGALKSADPSFWGEILAVPGVTFVNLQYGDCAEELAAVKGRLGIDVFHDRHVDPLVSMDDFFAQVAAMDLVISTSNTTVHVAGSLNTPVWLLLSPTPVSMWYWLLNRADSPWYPSLRILRSPFQATNALTPDVWGPAVGEAGLNLRRLAQGWP